MIFLAFFSLIVELFIFVPMPCFSTPMGTAHGSLFKSTLRQSGSSGPVPVQSRRPPPPPVIVSTKDADKFELLKALWDNSRYKDSMELLADEIEEEQWNDLVAKEKLALACAHPNLGGIEYLFGKGIFWFPDPRPGHDDDYLNVTAYDQFNRPSKESRRRSGREVVTEVLRSKQPPRPPMRVSQRRHRR